MGFFSGLYNKAKETIGKVYDFGKNHIGKIGLGLALALSPKAYDMLPNELRRNIGFRWDETLPVGNMYGSSYRMFK